MGDTLIYFNNASQHLFTIEEAIEELKKTACVRPFEKTLAAYVDRAEGRNSKEFKLYLREIMEKTDAIVEPDSHRRVVNNWIKNRTKPNKTSIYKLCFALGLSPKSRDEGGDAHIISLLMSRLSGHPTRFGQPPHWRTPSELVYLCGLNLKWTWTHTCEVMENLRQKGLVDSKTEDLPAYHFSPQYLDDRPRAEPKFTQIVYQEAMQLQNEAQLETYLRENQSLLGEYHNEAYRMLRDMMKMVFDSGDAVAHIGGDPLENGGYIAKGKEDEKDHKDVLTKRVQKKLAQDAGSDTYDKETRLMAERAGWIMDHYMHYLRAEKKNETKAAANEAIRKMIEAFWPTETKLKEMIRRKRDVSRAVLVLLFLATRYEKKSWIADDDDSPYDFDYQSLFTELTATLQTCGFAPLDPLHPFDWMVIYCLAADSDDDEENPDALTTDETLERFVKLLAGDDSPFEA